MSWDTKVGVGSKKRRCHLTKYASNGRKMDGYEFPSLIGDGLILDEFQSLNNGLVLVKKYHETFNIKW